MLTDEQIDELLEDFDKSPPDIQRRTVANLVAKVAASEAADVPSDDGFALTNEWIRGLPGWRWDRNLEAWRFGGHLAVAEWANEWRVAFGSDYLIAWLVKPTRGDLRRLVAGLFPAVRKES